MDNNQFPPPNDEDSGSENGKVSGSDANLNGYISPSNRPWIHPSELGGIGATPLRGRRVRPSVFLSVAAAVVLIAGVAVVAAANNQPGSSPSVTPTTAVALKQVPKVLRGSAELIVLLEIKTGASFATASGILVNPQEVVTTRVISSMSSINVISVRGQHVTATLIKCDAASGISVLHLNQALVGASMTLGSTAISQGPAMVVSATCRSCATSTLLAWDSATVTNTNQAMMHNRIDLETVTASSPGAPMSGSALINTAGVVIGIASPSLGPETYLPISFVTQEVHHLVDAPSDGHGYLQIQGTNGPSGGALVQSIDQKSPAVGLLRVGDVITKINGQSIQSMAGLVDALYTLPGGSSTELTVTNNAHQRIVNLRLASSP